MNVSPALWWELLCHRGGLYRLTVVCLWRNQEEKGQKKKDQEEKEQEKKKEKIYMIIKNHISKI